MLRVAVCLALLLGALCPLAAQSAANPAPAPPASAAVSNAPLTLGPDTLTFPELAQKLCVDGHKVTCSPALEQYAAYVYVKNRTWDKTRHLLEQGLQVQFRADKDNPNNLTIEWDSDTRRRERAWFTRYTENMQRYLQEQVSLRAGYALLAPDTLQQQYEGVQAQIKDLEAKNQTDTPRYQQIGATSSGMEDAQRIQSSADARLGFSWAQNNLLSTNDVQNIVHYGSAYHIQDTAQIPADMLAPVLAKHSKPKADGKPLRFAYATGGWRLQQIAHSTQLELSTRLMTPDGFLTPLLLLYLPLPQNAQDVFVGISTGEAQHFGGLGKAAVQWLQNEQKQTHALLTDARLHGSLPFQPTEGSGDCSRLLELWSKKRDTEAVMALWPFREAMRINLRDDKVAVSGAFNTASAWTLHLYEDVICVQNAMAFVDREQTLPTAALVQYARSAANPGAVTPLSQQLPASSDTSEYNRLRAYCAAAANAPLPYWSYPLHILSYRDVETISLDKSVGAMFLWEHLPAQQRDALLQQARKMSTAPDANINVPLTRFSVRDREKLVQVLRGWGTEYPDVSLPGYLDALSGCTLYVRTQPGGHKGLYQVSLEVLNPDNSDFMVWGCEARFLWQP